MKKLKTPAQRPRKAPSNQTGGTAWGKKLAAEFSRMMQSADMKKLILLNFPYIIAFYMVEKAAWLYRHCNGDSVVDRLMVLFMNFGLAYKSVLPSFHPFDLMVGLVGAAVLKAVIYFKGKNAKKYRQGEEYGSARWGNQKDIEPFIDPVFENNVILTQTERLMMSGRPKHPKHARNKNVIVIGGSGSGKTRFYVNSECKQAIHEAIADNYDGMYLGDGAVDQVVRQYGMERVGYILANTLHHKSYDGRFSHSNKEWAEQVSTPEHNAERMTFRTDWVVDSHPAVLDGFVTMYRDELEAQKKLEQEQPFVKQFYVVENLQAAPLKIERFGNLDDAMSQYQALPNHCMKALGVEKNPDPLPGSLDILQCKNGIDTIVEDYKTVPGWDNPYIQNHVVQPLQGVLAVQDVELAYELPDAYFHIQTCDDGFDYTLYNKDFTEQDGGILETDGDKPVREAMTELLAEFGCDAAQGRVMDAAELREQADMVAEQQAEVLKEKLAAERPVPEETLSFYVAECLEFTFAGEFHDHLTMEEALEAYDKIPSERMNADKCIGFCIEEDGGFVGMYELVVNDKVQRENINSINYFRDDKLVQQAISDMEKLMAARQQSKEQERSSTKKSVLDALRSLKAKKKEQPAQEQDKPKKAKKKGMEL